VEINKLRVKEYNLQVHDKAHSNVVNKLRPHPHFRKLIAEPLPVIPVKPLTLLPSLAHRDLNKLIKI
jgi:hypothetical protein